MRYKESQYNMVLRSDDSRVIIYNSVSGALSVLSNEVYEKLHLGCPEDTPYLEKLLQQGYAVDHIENEFNKLLVARNAYIYEEPESLHYVIAPTMTCNLKCIYCFERTVSKLNNAQKTMSKEVIDSTISFLLNQISKHSRLKKVCINWFGGEPLLCIDTVCRISHSLIELCTERGIEYSAFIITNGLLLTRENSCVLREECLVNRLQLTVDGDDFFYARYKNADRNALSHLISNMEYASRLFQRIDVRMNTSVENQKEIIDIAKKIMQNKNISKTVMVYPARITDCVQEQCHSMTEKQFEVFRQRFEEELKPYNRLNGSLPLSRKISFCSIIRKDYCVIGSDGCLYRCEHELGNKSEVIGHVSTGFYRNRADMKFLNMRFDKKCKQCNLFPFCVGGCPAMKIIYRKPVDCASMRKRIMDKIEKEILSKWVDKRRI